MAEFEKKNGEEIGQLKKRKQKRKIIML